MTTESKHVIDENSLLLAQYAAVIRYRVSLRQGESEYDALVLACCAYDEILPNQANIAKEVMHTISVVSQQHTDWFWRGIDYKKHRDFMSSQVQQANLIF